MGCCGPTGDDIKSQVKARYAGAALRVMQGEAACCGTEPAREDDRAHRGPNPITSNLYSAQEAAEVPSEATQASLGCGNPVALADLRPGEIVLDLGSGGGLDIILSARRVGPTGKAYGLDMTDEMLALARENQAKAGVSNVEFLKGEIEQIPLPDAAVDVIISNCVINLSVDKPRVFAEAFRVLRPGGRFAVHDIVTRGPVPDVIRRSMGAWTGCLAGTLEEEEYRRLLGAAGFDAVEVEPTRVYRTADARTFLGGQAELVEAARREGLSLDDLLALADGKYVSAFVRAIKPAGRAAVARPRIGAARAEELEAVVGLLADVGLPGIGVAEHIDRFLVARAGGEIVGSVGLEAYGAHGLLRSLAVAPAYRKLGLGVALTHQLLGQARGAGISRVYLLTETAERFFATQGFQRVTREEAAAAVGESAEIRSACCDSAACMRLDL